LIIKYSHKFPWIVGEKIKRENDFYDTEFGYSRVIKFGIDQAINHSKKKCISTKYIGILDADIILESNYFETLQTVADKEEFGIVSGLIHDEAKQDIESDDPRGAARLYNIRCLDDIGGYPITPAVDTVTNIKAVMRGWKIQRIGNTQGYQNRPSWSGTGLWNGYKRKAEGKYYLNYHPINAILTGLLLFIKPPFYPGLAFIYGYTISYISKKSQTEDMEIKEYFWNQINNIRFRRLSKRLSNWIMGER
jgi:hypothetical protein